MLLRQLERVSRWARRPRITTVRSSGFEVAVRSFDVRFGQVLDELRGQSRVWRVMSSLLELGGTFLDIGANHGAYSLLAGKAVGPTGRVIAFEASPELACCLRFSLSRNLEADWSVVEGALGDRSEVTEFFFDPIGSGTGSLFRSFVGRRAVATRVSLRTLDTVLASEELRGNIVIKLDVEGAELAVLRGARALLRGRRPAVIVECNPDSAAAAGTSVDAVLNELVQAGYDTFADTRDYPKTCPPDELDVSRQGDFVALA